MATIALAAASRATRRAPVPPPGTDDHRAADSTAATADDDAPRLRYYYPGSIAQGGYHVLSEYANVIRICSEGDKGKSYVNDLTFVWKAIVCRWFVPEDSAHVVRLRREVAVEEHREAVNRLREAIHRFRPLHCCRHHLPEHRMTKIFFVIEKAKLESEGHDVPDDAPVFMKEEPSPGCNPVQYVEAPDWKVLEAVGRIYQRLKPKSAPQKEHEQVLHFVNMVLKFLDEMPRDCSCCMVDSHLLECIMKLLTALQVAVRDLKEREESCYAYFVGRRGKENPDYTGYLCDKALLQERRDVFPSCQMDLDRLLQESATAFNELPPLSTEAAEIRRSRVAATAQLRREVADIDRCMRGALARLRDYKKFEQIVTTPANFYLFHCGEPDSSGHGSDVLNNGVVVPGRAGDDCFSFLRLLADISTSTLHLDDDHMDISTFSPCASNYLAQCGESNGRGSSSDKIGGGGGGGEGGEHNNSISFPNAGVAMPGQASDNGSSFWRLLVDVSTSTLHLDNDGMDISTLDASRFSSMPKRGIALVPMSGCKQDTTDGSSFRRLLVDMSTSTCT